ncbi:hypothetical protein IRZ71_12435 [Flavobacterium sp. ANB]|uniref:hypothetical protein n=1 Tax=unclassified Flavobacterium TaxID=196869 RepID=UPI0012B83A9A|nr:MULTISPECIES: hypothetical protein [unclassified Flavobacterium]MBF4517162.1 hypothetical protein [Flavobacterium sp. ANB]MTD71898.1 hypothetical protein [Flavobacterium sp. LC2016-13]
MKNLQKFMFLAVAFFALALSSSCSSDDAPDTPKEEETVITGDFIKFKYKGTEYKFDPVISVSGALNIYGSTGIDDTYKKVSLWMPTAFTVGSHPVVYDLSSLGTTYQASFTFAPGINNASATSGTINITAKTDTKIEGTFTLNGTSGQETFAVTEGSFRITTD